MRQRRIEQCDKFSAACVMSDRFSYWFPKKTGCRSARGTEQYLESFMRCKRLQNSPLFYMRRRLNGKAGKTYGSRNHERREEGYIGGTTTVAWMEREN